MIERFQGIGGRRLRVDALASQKMILGDQAIAEELADRCQLEELREGQVLIEQDDDSNDLYFILSGSFRILVNGFQMATRGPGDHVGEMAAIEPTQRRSASVIASASSVVARITEADFSELAGRKPELYRGIARDLARRLLERNKHVNVHREKVKVFIISSVEVLPVARAVQAAFEHDPFTCTVWTDGVFRATSYALAALEAAVDDADFAIAIAHSDDVTSSREKTWPAPRDNVVFELGLFMGRLGRERAILMEPREEKLKLPSDLAGVITIPYRFEPGKDMAALLGPACTHLRTHINLLGAYNG
jgi:predicted nucleotide-binding protein